MSASISFLNSRDFSYDIQLKEVGNSYVIIDLTCYSRKYSFLDIELQFKTQFQEIWRSDFKIECDSPITIRKNKIFNIPASFFGTSTQLKIIVPQHYLGHQIDFRTKLIPRFLSYGYSGLFSTVSESNENLLNYKEGIDKKAINYTKDLNLICLTGNGVFLYKVGENTPLKSYQSLSSPQFAIQIESGFLVADANGITELNENLNYVRDKSIPDSIYLDYNLENKTILVTRTLNNIGVEEYTWGDGNYGDLIWSSSEYLLNPLSATYKKEDASIVLISDAEQNRVIQEDRTNQIIKNFVTQTIYKNEGSDSTLFNLTSPLKAVGVGDDIHVFEKGTSKFQFYDYDENPIYPIGTGIIGVTFEIA